MAALVDPTATGKYPVILADGLLPDTDSTTIFTGIRCTSLAPYAPFLVPKY